MQHSVESATPEEIRELTEIVRRFMPERIRRFDGVVVEFAEPQPATDIGPEIERTMRRIREESALSPEGQFLWESYVKSKMGIGEPMSERREGKTATSHRSDCEVFCGRECDCQSQTKTMTWIKTEDEKPPLGVVVIGISLNRPETDDWYWTEPKDMRFDGFGWGDWEAPDYWMQVVGPEIPESPEREKAKAIGIKRREIRAKIKKLQEELSMWEGVKKEIKKEIYVQR